MQWGLLCGMQCGVQCFVHFQWVFLCKPEGNVKTTVNPGCNVKTTVMYRCNVKTTVNPRCNTKITVRPVCTDITLVTYDGKSPEAHKDILLVFNPDLWKLLIKREQPYKPIFLSEEVERLTKTCQMKAIVSFCVFI